MYINKPFTKENMDMYLKELAKEFRKRNGKIMPAEIILIGGASILVNYGFREMTYDIDAIIEASSAMKDAINAVGDLYELPVGWLNTDFSKTSSYSPRLVEHSKYYKTFGKILQIRTVSAEYLVAMKLMAGRKYKNDLSDVIGILIEQEKRGKPLTLDMIKTAIVNLYGKYEAIPNSSRTFIESVYSKGNLYLLYVQYKELELANKESLISFQKEYPGALNKDNILEVLTVIKERKNNDK